MHESETNGMDATNPTSPADVAPVSQSNAAIVAAPSYDEPYRFGRRPTSRAPFPFTEREFARLLIVRGRLQSQVEG
jgi:hypothetical protein